jgi:hypothetical protein
MKVQAADPTFPLHYDATMAFDCQRSPAYPTAGQNFRVYGFANPIPKDGPASGLDDTYLMLSYLGTYGSLDGENKYHCVRLVDE